MDYLFFFRRVFNWDPEDIPSISWFNHFWCWDKSSEQSPPSWVKWILLQTKTTLPKLVTFSCFLGSISWAICTFLPGPLGHIILGGQALLFNQIVRDNKKWGSAVRWTYLPPFIWPGIDWGIHSFFEFWEQDIYYIGCLTDFKAGSHRSSACQVPSWDHPQIHCWNSPFSERRSWAIQTFDKNKRVQYLSYYPTTINSFSYLSQLIFVYLGQM